jgi:hypothetical protein
VAPDRLAKDFDDVLSSAGATRRHASGGAWFVASLQAWQAVNTWWQDEFIDFNEGKQLNLLGALGLKDRDFESLVILLGVGGTLWLSLLAWRGRQRPALPRDALSRAWGTLERSLRHAACAREPHEGPIAYSERIAGERPDLAATFGPLARHYARLRYGPDCSPEQLQGFRRAVRLFTARMPPRMRP